MPLPGSVSLSLDANGEPENFYADGIAYYVINNNMGYDGDLELALIPESFRTDVLREKLDAKGVLIENSDAELALFALLFEFDGDVRHIRHVMYNCSASRPKIEGKTNEEKKEVQTETLTIKATPLSDGKVKAKTGNTTDTTVYADWYKSVYLPAADPSIPDNPEEWLDEFNTFSIYQVLPKLIELWGMNIRTDVEAKKNFMQQTVK